MAPSVVNLGRPVATARYIASEVPSQRVERQVEQRLAPPSEVPVALQPAIDQLLGKFNKLDRLDELPELLEPVQTLLNEMAGLRDMIEAQLKPLSKVPTILAMLQVQQRAIEMIQADIVASRKPKPSVWSRIKGIFRAPHSP